MSESQVKWEFSKKITGHSWKSYTVVLFAAIGVILCLGMALNSYEPI